MKFDNTHTNQKVNENEREKKKYEEKKTVNER